MDAHPERMELLQHRAQLRRDPLREEDRHAAADAQELDVLDRAQAAEEIPQAAVGKQQRVAAGEQHVAHLGVLLQVIDGAVEIELQLLLAHAADHPAAGAVAAVGGAAIGDQEEDAVRVAVDEAGHGHVVVLAAGIGEVAGRVGHLLDARDDLAADGAGRVEGIDEVEEVGRDAHGQLGVGQEHAGVFLAGELNFALEIGERLDAVAQLPLPVVPLRGGGVGPEALAGRGE